MPSHFRTLRGYAAGRRSNWNVLLCLRLANIFPLHRAKEAQEHGEDAKVSDRKPRRTETTERPCRGQRPDAAPRDHVGDSTGGITKDGKVRGGGEFPICATCGEKVTTSWEAHADECEGEDFGADAAPVTQDHSVKKIELEGVLEAMESVITSAREHFDLAAPQEPTTADALAAQKWLDAYPDPHEALAEARKHFRLNILLVEYAARENASLRQENERLEDLRRRDPYEYREGECCGDAHLELRTALEHIKILGFEVENREGEGCTEILWRNARAEKSEATVARLEEALRQIARICA